MNKVSGVVLGLVLCCTGCYSKIEVLPPHRDARPSVFDELADPDTLVGLAVSGGGSRAATYAAGALEALAGIRIKVGGRERSVLETISHMSSVSGGSLATAYYAMKKPPREEAILADRGLSPAYERFFADFKEAMQEDFQSAAFRRQVLFFRALNPTKFAYSFAEVWDDRFFGEADLAALYEREKRGDSPRIIFNGTSYNDGRRLVLTTLPPAEFEYDFVSRLLANLKARPGTVTPEGMAIIEGGLSEAGQQFLPMTFEQWGGSHRNLRVSLAVATSASFPPVVGPVTYQIAGRLPYHHVGDGGLFDNLGTESLTTVFLKKIPRDSAKRGLIIVIDASYPFEATGIELNEKDKGFQVFTDDPSRIVGIMEERANAYQMMLWHSLRTEGVVLPDFSHLRIVVLKHIDADWAGYEDLPPACRQDFPRDVTALQIKQAVSEIPTLFKIKTPCHGALLNQAAHKVVEKYRHRIVKWLESP
jgi:predicted acylesterase/phospholipase RssA